MSTSPEKPGAQDDEQRKALEESQKKATEQEPENFKDKATDEKVVEIGPDMKDAPIKGIDAPERPGSGR
jgi:flagellar motility protein MotE (MotC chaperone)